MNERLEFIKTHPLFLGGLLGTIIRMLIMDSEDVNDLFKKAFTNHPEHDGYTAVALSISESDFRQIKDTVLDLKVPDLIKPTDPLEILSRTMSTSKPMPYQNILRILYTKTLPNELVSGCIN